MVKVFAILKPVLHLLMKLVGMAPQTVEIEPGTVMNIWAPSQTIKKSKTHHNQTNPKPTKPAVVFLHGFGADGIHTWVFQILALAGKYSVYVPDLIFFGGSTTNQPDRSTGFQVDCLATGLRKLGVEKCTVVGLSYGGLVGFKMAELHPQMVECLVVSSTVTELTQSISRESLRNFGFSRLSDLLFPESVKGVKLLFSICTHKLPWLPDFVYRDFLAVMFKNRKERAEFVDALVISDKDAALPIYPQRIHMLWGEDDKIFKVEFAQNMKEQLGDKASLQCIKKAGHLVQLEQPCVYNRQLKKILEPLKTKESGSKDPHKSKN